MTTVTWTLSGATKSEKGEAIQRVLGMFPTKRAMVLEMDRVRAPKTAVIKQGNHCYLVALPSK